MLDLIEQILSRAKSAEPVAVCIVAKTRGSTPQKAGAIMLVFQNGQTTGTLGGGCVEAEVKTRALKLMQTNENRLLTFALDHDLGWDDGLVCGGTMDVAVQIIAAPDQAASFREACNRLANGIPADVQIAVRGERDQLVHFSTPIQPAPTLVTAGAGHVGAALAAVASQMDFRVIVIDDRP